MAAMLLIAASTRFESVALSMILKVEQDRVYGRRLALM